MTIASTIRFVPAFIVCMLVVACGVDYSHQSIAKLKKKFAGVYFEITPVYPIAHTQALADYANSLRIELKKNKIRFTSLFYDNQKFVLKFYNPDERFSAYQWIKKHYESKKIKFKINRTDLQNEFALKFQLAEEQLDKINSRVIDRISVIIKKRGELLEAKYTKIENRGGKLAIYMVGLNDIKVARSLLHMNRKVYFSEASKKNPKIPALATVDREDINDKQGLTYSVSTHPIITNNQIKNVVPGYGANNSPAIQVTLNTDGSKKMERATRKLINKTIVAVVAEYDFNETDKTKRGNYRVKKMVISAATVKTPIAGRFMLTGLRSVHVAQLYSYQFASGYYPVPIRINLASTVVPPKLKSPRE